MISEEYIRELHDRNYSLYASPRLEKQALDELHEQDYMIFNEDETLQLYEDYEKELKLQNQTQSENRSNDMSGVFLSKDSVAPMANATVPKQETSSHTLNRQTPNIHLHTNTQSLEKNHQDCRETELYGILDSIIASRKDDTITSVRANGTKAKTEQLLYLKMDNGVYRHCNAIGTYESSTNRFTIKAGSVITRDVLPRFEGTEKNEKRKAFIAVSCEKKHNGYIILRDVLFDSPGEATFIVLGRAVSGWDFWKNKNGHTIRELYKQ